ncbi:MAG: hypothetical protein ACR2RV_23090, partial [Verrucomicrobiales bacterium]
MKPINLPLLATAVLISLTGLSSAAVFWQDDDPLGASSTTVGGLTVTNVNSGPAIDASHPTAGAVDHAGAVPFSNISPSAGPGTITAADYGQAFSYTIDYFVPAGTVMAGGDLFYVQLNFNSSANGTTGPNLSAGFVGAAAAGSGWNTITLSGT